MSHRGHGPGFSPQRRCVAGSSAEASLAHAPPPAWALDLDLDLVSHCEPGRKLRVAALLSGGVDSSVALALAQRAGHEVEAFYLQIWFQEDFRNTWDACPWEEDLEYCKQVRDGVGGCVDTGLVQGLAVAWAGMLLLAARGGARRRPWLGIVENGNAMPAGQSGPPRRCAGSWAMCRCTWCH